MSARARHLADVLDEVLTLLERRGLDDPEKLSVLSSAITLMACAVGSNLHEVIEILRGGPWETAAAYVAEARARFKV